MDWNEDGLNDLIVGEYSGQIRYFRNTGSPINPQLTFDSYLQLQGDTLDIGDYSVPWIDDWNEDGLKDLLVGEAMGRVGLFLNEGTNAAPLFNITRYLTLANGDTIDVTHRSAPIVVDLDNDGLKDLVSGEILGGLLYYKNVGSNENPQLVPPVNLCIGQYEIYLSGTSRPAPIDWDVDGDWDLVVGSYNSRLQLFHQTLVTEPQPTVLMTSATWVVPASGGYLNLTFTLENSNPTFVTTDVWTEARFPDDSFYGPVLTRTSVGVSANTTLNHSLDQYVPPGAPPGFYTLYAYTGNSDLLQVASSSSINIIKADGGDGTAGEWSSIGWESFEETPGIPFLPETVSVSAWPNPFNPSTVINFTLPQTAWVTLDVVDLTGRRVATLMEGYREPGQHQALFDATGFASGVYLFRISAENFKQVGKLLLLK